MKSMNIMVDKIKFAYELIGEDPTKFLNEFFRHLTVVSYLKYSFRQFEHDRSLPEEIQVCPHDINYSLSIKNEYFPTDDKKAEALDGPFDQPIVGVLGGPWDKLKKHWWENNITTTLQNRYERGVKWEHTTLWQNNKRYREGRAETIDGLFKSMKRYGYVPQKELTDIEPKEGSIGNGDMSSSTIKICNNVYPNECRVGIGRNGEIIRFAQARHRITIAKILGLDPIPVLVLVRHKRWNKIRQEFNSAESVNDVPTEYLQYSKHPDIVGLID